MSTIDTIARKYEQTIRNIDSNILSVMSLYGNQLLSDFRARSALDTGRYKRSWRFLKPKSSASGFSMTFKNPVNYAHYLVRGVDIGDPPWYFTGKRRSGKLFIGRPRGSLAWWPTGGRRAVWAGGKNPGKENALGGIKGGLYSNGKFQKKFIRSLTTALLKGN